jgi:hypothetical protein
MCPDLGFDRSHTIFKHTHAAVLLQVNYQVILRHRLHEPSSGQVSSQCFNSLTELSHCPPLDRGKDTITQIDLKYKNF